MNQDNLQLVPADAAATAELVRGWREQYPDLGLLALVPEAEQAAVPMLQAVCREQGVPLVGAILLVMALAPD